MDVASKSDYDATYLELFFDICRQANVVEDHDHAGVPDVDDAGVLDLARILH